MKNPIIGSAIKIIFGMAVFSSGFGRENLTNTLVPMILGALLIWWGLRPVLKWIGPNRSASGKPATSPTPGRSAEAADVSYPFKNMGMAHACEPTDFIVLDTETTGFSPKDDKVIEVAAVKIRGGKASWFHSLVNPGRRIPDRSVNVHGITDADVAQAPAFSQILPELDAFLDKDLPIVGQSVLFDLRILWWEYHDAGRDLGPRQFVDTAALSKKAFPDRKSYSLASLIEDYDLLDGKQQEHRSKSDVYATLALYELCRETLADSGK